MKYKMINRYRASMWDGEAVLNDAIDHVCQFLTAKDLCNVSAVCKFWNEAVKREQNKRCHPQCLPISFDHENLGVSEKEFWNDLRVKPLVGIIFMETRLRQQIDPAYMRMGFFENDVLNTFRKRVPRALVGLEVQDVITDQDVMYNNFDMHCQAQLETMGKKNIFGLFLPAHKSVRFHVTWTTGCCGLVDGVANKMIDNLGLNEANSENSTLILFAQSTRGYFINETVEKIVRKRFSKVKMWGGMLERELIGLHCQKSQDKYAQKAFVCLRVSGPTLDSWTLTIDCSEKKDLIEQQLWQFSEKIQRKKCTVGMIYGPRDANYKGCYYGGHKMMSSIKRIFQGIPFTGLFSAHGKVIFDDDFNDNGSHSQSIAHKYASILIMAYD